MIRITQQNSADGAKRYYATADYYSEGQELVGSWGGKAAERLGLSGTVDKASFERLCDNLDPRTGKALTVRNRSERTVGYDFTFSVPKSVSLLYAMTSDPAMLNAFREAVAETMREVEVEMKTRVRKGGQDDTVARFVKDQTMQQSVRNGVILVDEASLLGTRDMHKLFTLAEDLNARVLLVGDRRQHRSVTAGEPLKLLEEKAGLPVAEVTDILRQTGNYKKAARALSQGRTKEAFEQLDKLGWIREAPDSERNQQIANAYLSAVAEKKRGGEFKSALIVSPTHVEGALVTAAVREGLKASGKLADERTVNSWVSSRLTDAQKTDPTQYELGNLLQFHQNAKGFKKGTRLIVKDEGAIPTQLANRFDVYRPVPMKLAVGDRIRITAGGKTKNGKHQLSNGTLLTVAGFTKKGDIIADHGWVIDRDFGHLAPGYVMTSYSSQGATVDKVIVSISSQSLPATDQRTAYVAITRGKEQALVFTDDRSELLRAIGREDQTLSATELAEARETGAKDSPQKRPAFNRFRGLFANWIDSPQQSTPSQSAERGLSHDR